VVRHRTQRAGSSEKKKVLNERIYSILFIPVLGSNLGRVAIFAIISGVSVSLRKEK